MRSFCSFCYTVQSSSTGGSNALRDILSLADPPEYPSVSRNSLSSIRSPRASTTQATSSQSSNLLSLADTKSTNLVQNTSSLLDDFPDGYHPDSPSKPSQPGSIADPIQCRSFCWRICFHVRLCSILVKCYLYWMCYAMRMCCWGPWHNVLWVCTDWTVFPSIVAMRSKGLKVTFDFAKASGSPQTTVIKASYYNTSPTPYTDFIFQAAVPKVS